MIYGYLSNIENYIITSVKSNIVIFKLNTYTMKYLKWLWIATLLFAVGYTINDYIENGFNDLLIVMCMGLAGSGVGFLNKK